MVEVGRSVVEGMCSAGCDFLLHGDKSRMAQRGRQIGAFFTSTVCGERLIESNVINVATIQQYSRAGRHFGGGVKLAAIALVCWACAACARITVGLNLTVQNVLLV